MNPRIRKLQDLIPRLKNRLARAETSKALAHVKERRIVRLTIQLEATQRALDDLECAQKMLDEPDLRGGVSLAEADGALSRPPGHGGELSP